MYRNGRRVRFAAAAPPAEPPRAARARPPLLQHDAQGGGADGQAYEALVRLRDNGVVASPMEPLKLCCAASNELAYSPQDKVAAEHGHHHGEALAVFIKPCFVGPPRHPGRQRQADRRAPPLVKAAIGLSFDTMSSIWTAPPPNMTKYFSKMRLIASQVTNAETLLSALLRLHNVTCAAPPRGCPSSTRAASTLYDEGRSRPQREAVVRRAVVQGLLDGELEFAGLRTLPRRARRLPRRRQGQRAALSGCQARAAGVCVNGSEWAREKLIKT